MLQKFKYRFDLLISQNPRGLLILLTIGSLLILAFISGLITLFDSDSVSFWTNYEEVINITLSPALKVHSSLFLTILYVFVAILGLLLISVLMSTLQTV
jgi:cytochrome b